MKSDLNDLKKLTLELLKHDNSEKVQAENEKLIRKIYGDEDEVVEEETAVAIPDQYYYMEELLRHVSSTRDETPVGDDFNSIVYQLIYLLPLDNSLKQQLLEVPDCHERATVLHAELIRLGIIQYVKAENN